MKRLVFLTLLLVPCAVATIEVPSPCAERHRPTIAPRVGRIEAPDLDDETDDGPSPVAASSSWIEVHGLPKATAERAAEGARRELDRVLARWLEPLGIPADWKAPEELVRRMTRVGRLERIEKDYGTVFVQTLDLDRSERQRDRLAEAYERELSGHRLVQLVEVLAVVLAVLAALAGYIRADEATQGYYTTHLRLAAAAGAAALGVAMYRILV